MQLPVTHRDYYDVNPSAHHSPGDLWRELPTFGLLPFSQCGGIVITPACDLANNKAETITYLPVISAIEWFGTTAFLPELRRTLDGQWKIVSDEMLLTWPMGYRIPEGHVIAAATEI